jgi:tRNA1(Val) A37 N6-methylase TrmN6
MEKEKILEKFGNENYSVNDNTYTMGIHSLLGSHIAERFKGFANVLEVCTGAGFMLMPLARNVNKVNTVEINPMHMVQAKSNFILSRINSDVKFVLGDIMNDSVLEGITDVEAAMLDPDWSAVGKEKTSHTTKLSEMQPPAEELFKRIFRKTQNIALRLPREIDLRELSRLPPHELEKIFLDGDFKFYCAYFGNLARKIGVTEFKASNTKVI